MKGVLSKKQRARKKLRQMEHFAYNMRAQEWSNFILKANRGNNDIADIAEDKKQAGQILEGWRKQNAGPTDNENNNK